MKREAPVLAVIVGIRSQYMKLAALQRSLDQSEHFSCKYIDSGQHYDDVLGGQYVTEYDLHFDTRLYCGSPEKTPTETLAQMIVRIEASLESFAPAGAVVFGDANTTLAGALAARRLGSPVAHLEAGVRTGAESPEELNRVIVDRISTLHMASTELDLERLKAEGFGSSSTFTGDVIRELCAFVVPETLGRRFGLVAIHRAENTQDVSVVRRCIEAVEKASLMPVVVFHPRVLSLVRANVPEILGRILPLVSVSHARILRLVKGAQVVVTDSGALQRESYYLERRAVVVQEKPFWPTLIESGFHVGGSPTGDLTLAVRSAVAEAPRTVVEFGGPGAVDRVVTALAEWLETR